MSGFSLAFCFMKYTIDKKENYTIITIEEKKLDTTVAPDLKSDFVKF